MHTRAPTSSAVYFPDTVEIGIKAIRLITSYVILRLWRAARTKKFQQGGMVAVTKSDEEHEYAASVFPKWFTQKNQNLRFVCESSYMVLKEANSVDALIPLLKRII